MTLKELYDKIESYPSDTMNFCIEDTQDKMVSLDKVCEYLETNFGIELCMAFGDKFIDKLRKAMEE